LRCDLLDARREGAEAMREAAAEECEVRAVERGSNELQYAANAIRALPLPAPVDAVERDADRFRWLMERNFGFAFDAERCGISTGRWGRWPEEPDEQRAMIDRAIAAEASAVRDGKGE
jgi:hypothetical protein